MHSSANVFFWKTARAVVLIAVVISMVTPLWAVSHRDGNAIPMHWLSETIDRPACPGGPPGASVGLIDDDCEVLSEAREPDVQGD
jgi:hypothetical protein